MNFKPYLENILKDEEFTKWQNLYIPLKAEDVIEELPTMPEVEDIILEKATLMDKETLQNVFKRNKYEFKTQNIITELIEVKNRRVILVGESGSGKTTLLKWITLLYAQQSFKELIDTGNIIQQRLPLYIDLGTYHKKIEVEGFLADILKAHDLEYNFEELITSFEAGKFLLLFDGLDLLSSHIEDFDPLVSIQKFINKYPKNIYLLSCRKGIHYSTFPTNYKIIELLTLSDERIVEYLTHYVKDANKRNEILAHLRREPQFKEACRTPLILLLIIAIFSRYKEIPTNKTQIYARYINCLYELFERIGKISHLEKELITDILSELGFELQVNDETVTSKERILDIITNFIIQHRYEKMAKDEILKLCSQLGFLKVEGEDVKFFYQSFREYFASLKLKELFLKGINISSTFTNPKWEDVLIFLTSNLESSDSSRLIQTILNTPYEFCNPLFVAAKCIIGSPVEEKLKQEIINNLLIKASDKYWYNQREAISGLTRILGEKIEVEAIESLIQKLKDEEWTRREKSAKAMGRLCDKGAISHLKRLLEDENPAVYNAAFEAIIEIERREKEALKIEFKEPEEVLPFPQIQEVTQIIPEKVEEKLSEEKIIPTETKTVVYMTLSRSTESVGVIQMEEAKSVIIDQVFNTIVKPIVESEHGEIEEMGENFTLVTFKNPKEGLYATVKMQGGIDEYNLRQPSRKVTLKIGVCTAKHGESYDRIKMIAANLGKLARPGQILVIENTYKSIHGKDKTIKFRYFGSRKLEGEEHLKRGIYELLWQGEEHASMIKESIMAIEYLEEVSAFNMTKNKPVMAKIKVARSFLARYKGLMFIKEPQPLVIEFPQSSGIKVTLHTFFVKFPIDVIFLDTNFKVVEFRENLPPFKFFISQALTKYVLELPQGTIKTSGVEFADIIIFKEGI